MKNEEWRIVGFADQETRFGVRRESQLYNLEFIVLSKASATHLQDSFDSFDSCSKKNIRVC